MSAAPTSDAATALPARLLAAARRALAPAWGRAVALARPAPGLAAVVAMAVVGLGISVYLTIAHYEKVEPACTTGGIVNCGAVTSSVYSVIPGTAIPITIPGMLWFVASGGVAAWSLTLLKRGGPEPPRLRLALLAWGALGLAFVLYLVYAELVRVNAICLWCTAIHVLTLLTFLVALTRAQRPPARPAPSPAARTSGARPSAGGPSARPAQRSIPAQRSASTAVRPQRKARRR